MNNPDVTEKQKTPAASTPASGSTTLRMLRRLITAWVIAFLAGFLPPVLMWIQFAAALVMLSLAYEDLKSGMSSNDDLRQDADSERGT